MRDSSKEFLLENWIFALLAVLAVLLALSAVLLDLRNITAAAELAGFTLFTLIVGVTARTAYYFRVGSATQSSWSEYLRRNWGAPFVFLFLVLIVASGISLGQGNSLLAIRVAIFSFSILVAGMLLEIGSRAKYNSGQTTTVARSKLLGSSLKYLRENWGAPFVLAFIALLVSSAALLSLGSSESANSIAVYAFYALVAGVVLQIASYVKYGSTGTNES